MRLPGGIYVPDDFRRDRRIYDPSKMPPLPDVGRMPPVGLAAAHVQTVGSSFPGGAVSIGVTLTTTTSAGVLALYVRYISSTVTISSITVSTGAASFTLVDTDDNVDGRGLRAYTYYAENITGGTTPTVTVNFSGSVNATLVVTEFSGCATSGSLDQHKMTPSGFFSSGTTDALTTGNVTTTTDGQALFGANCDAADGTTVVAGSSPWTGRFASGNGSCSETQIQAAAGAVAATFTKTAGNGYMTPAIMTFKAAGGGAAATWPGYIGGGFF